MATDGQQQIQQSDLQGVRSLKRVMPLLSRLRPEGTARDRAGNRKLFFDQYCGLVLLSMFTPILSSMRGIQQISGLKNVQQMLGCSQTSSGALSEAPSAFDPQPLREIAAEMIEQTAVTRPDPRLNELAHCLTAVDGSILVALPQITQAMYQQKRNGPAPDGWRLHAHFEVIRGVPVRMEVTDARNSGDSSEKAVLRRSLEADRCYVVDRGYEQFALFNAIVDAGSSYVCRIRNDHGDHFQIDETRPLSDAAQQAGVLEDCTGVLGSPKSRRIVHPHHRMRLVRVKFRPHPKGSSRRRKADPQDIVLVTNLLDVPPEIIALIYRYRWMIELFFRFFKHVLGCRRLLSRRARGIEIQVYCALIACLLMANITGSKPALRTYEMLCCLFIGLASKQEFERHLRRLKPPQP